MVLDWSCSTVHVQGYLIYFIYITAQLLFPLSPSINCLAQGLNLQLQCHRINNNDGNNSLHINNVNDSSSSWRFRTKLFKVLILSNLRNNGSMKKKKNKLNISNLGTEFLEYICFNKSTDKSYQKNKITVVTN